MHGERFFSSMLRILLVAACVTAPSAAQQTEGGRFALLIGNGAYEHNTRLQNPSHDAEDLAAVLSGVGFQAELLVDGTLADMEDALFRFRDRLKSESGSAGLFFFAGHAVQSQGINYLLPVDQDIRSEAQLRRAAIPAGEVLEYMNEAGNRFNMVILDACRNNPLTGSFRSASRGLAVIGSVPPETVVLYSTGAGEVAEDGSGRNSPFSAALIRHIAAPGQEVEPMLREITKEVQSSTISAQTPYRYSNLTADFYFSDGTAPVREATKPVIHAADPPFLPIMANGKQIRWGDELYAPGFWGGYPEFLEELETRAGADEALRLEIDSYRSFQKSGVFMQVGGLAILGLTGMLSMNLDPGATDGEKMMIYSGIIGGALLGTWGMVRTGALPIEVIDLYNSGNGGAGSR